MSTHIADKEGQIADSVLLLGDSLHIRARVRKSLPRKVILVKIKKSP